MHNNLKGKESDGGEKNLHEEEKTVIPAL